jgi:hypothetical protein
MLKTVLEAYQDGTLKLSKYGEVKYNVADHPAYLRGDMGKGKPKAARIYSAHSFDSVSRLVRLESKGAWGDKFFDVFPAHTLIILTEAEKEAIAKR